MDNHGISVKQSDNFSRRLAFGGIIIIIATFSKSFLNLLYQIGMSRLLLPSDFGLLSSILAIYVILAIPSRSISLATAKLVSTTIIHKPIVVIKVLFFHIVKFILPLFVIVSLLLIFFSPAFAVTLKVEIGIIALIGATYTLSVASPVIEGIFQGLENNGRLGISLLILPILKIGLSFTLVFLGFEVIGAIWGLIFASIISPLLLMIFISPYLRGGEEELSETFNFRTILPVLITDLGFILFFNVDLLLVRVFFSPIESGYYAVISVVGRTILYIASSIAIVMIPKAVKSHESGQDARKVLMNSLLISITLSIVSVIIILFLGDSIILIIFGKTYRSVVIYLPLLVVVFLIYGVVGILTNFNVALNNYSLNIPLFLGICIEIVGIVLYHDSLFTVLTIMLFSACFMVFGLICLIFLKRWYLKINRGMELSID
ncbi:MAG: oligosaccharide flippase family protein [Candidatus Heimdallarchaeota archaeon]|nr:MAG: oligosaccharide flippase family protein [Candidatus Heimdallarchaeota archaeon]